MRLKTPTVCDEGKREITLQIDRKSYEILQTISNAMACNGTPESIEQLATATLQEQFPRSMHRSMVLERAEFYRRKATK